MTEELRRFHAILGQTNQAQTTKHTYMLYKSKTFDTLGLRKVNKYTFNFAETWLVGSGVK